MQITLTLHYRTIGTPARDSAGTTQNAVLLLHETTGSGRFFLGSRFCEALYGPGSRSIEKNNGPQVAE